MKSMGLALAVVVGMGLAGCKKEGEAGGGGGGGGGGGSIGVKECDEYVTKYEACIGKMPGAAKDQAAAAFKMQRESLQKSAATPEGKAALASSCKQMIDAIKATCP